ncbi:hypothetical protein K0T92_24340 [Paenibacillus oenotherae]|uniref:Uncharacterized protein n=1 Tax=Paenibacillus oenotherae TaxID=1435645 RepID=A0ABS7DD21_9BACL|nr:hypothetical protein [Paenibacillus oenotherae]MBW7477843.1 hypothetical protein [Paenibacillus oenotherae]
MDQKIIARINWVPTEQGGKKRFPLIEYSTAAQFLVDEVGQGWSVVLKIVSNHDNYETICDFSFLFPDRAPKRLLFVGSKFELYESKKVADGEIIEC